MKLCSEAPFFAVTGGQREMGTGKIMGVHSWPIWLGAVGIVIAVVLTAVLDVHTVTAGAVPINHTVLHAPALQLLRSAFLLIALGALWRLRAPLSPPWRWAVRVAMIMLACAVTSDLVGALVRAQWIADPSAGLGAIDSLAHRLLRLATMAAYAIPMLGLLAAVERKGVPIAGARRIASRIGALLVRWEPVLFAIGASTLATVLAAAAFIHKEFTWALPIGADTTVAGCGAAAIRARWRADWLAFGGWLAVCVSMGVGFLMGSYAFDGPLPAPRAIGGYGELARMLLRDGHVMLLSLGVVSIAAGITQREGAA
jgi:hypothetical protein